MSAHAMAYRTSLPSIRTYSTACPSGSPAGVVGTVRTSLAPIRSATRYVTSPSAALAVLVALAGLEIVGYVGASAGCALVVGAGAPGAGAGPKLTSPAESAGGWRDGGEGRGDIGGSRGGKRNGASCPFGVPYGPRI